MQYLTEWQENKKPDQDEPFFAYLPFSAPHWPLQAPEKHIQNYRGVYDEGPEVLRQKRLANLVKLGMIGADTEAHPVVDDRVEGWDEFTGFERKMSCRTMEAYAGMIEVRQACLALKTPSLTNLQCIDANVGKVVDHLERTGELDNTFIMFMSDNGAEGAAYEAYPLVSGSLMGHIKKYYNNELDNIGAADSFVWYGPRWAQAATAPSRLYKLYTTEGGVRVPCIAWHPGMPAAVKHDFATVMDIAPTLLEMAGIKHPAPIYKGREVAHMRGKSMLSWLQASTPETYLTSMSCCTVLTTLEQGDTESVHPKDFVMGWELCGRAAIRAGEWKAVFIPAPKGPHKWQLYNLGRDVGEIHDLADSQPEKLAELLDHWEQYVKECGVVPLHPEHGAYLEAVEEQMTVNTLPFQLCEEGVYLDN